MKKLLLAALAAALLGAPALANPAILGSWDTAIQTPDGVFESTIIVTEADGAYAVEVVDNGPMALEGTVSDVAVNENELTFKRALDFQGTPFEIDYALTVDGDSISGTATSMMGDAPVSGMRADADAAE